MPGSTVTLVGVGADGDLDGFAGVSQAGLDLLAADHDRPAGRDPGRRGRRPHRRLPRPARSPAPSRPKPGPRLRGARPGTAQPPRLPEPIVVTRRSEPQVRLVSWSVMRRTRRTRGVLSLPQTRGAGNRGSGRVASGPGGYYADWVRNAALRAFRRWVPFAVITFVLMEIAQQVDPGLRWTLGAIGASIATATFGRLSFSAGMAIMRRIRSRRAVAVTAARARQPVLTDRQPWIDS
jgi:hypothetical protein